MALYKVIADDFDILDKKIKRIIKKLDNYNLSYTYEITGESIEEVSIYNANFQGRSKVGTTNVKVINYDFEMESLKLGNYKLIAILDHTTKKAQNNNNMVYIVNNEIPLPINYYTESANCQHCNINHRQRNKTAILYNTDTSEYKQVGITCLKEYTGIDCIDIIKGYTDIYDIINDLDKMEISYNDINNYKEYKKVIDYLANCIYFISNKGYVKDDTKNQAWDYKEKVDKKYYNIAAEVINYYKNINTYDNFINNIRVALLQDSIYYPNGFIAYAYISYKKDIEKLEAIENKKLISKGYYGNIKERITLNNLKVELITSYENCYDGYNCITTYLYKFINSDGYVFTWKTQNSLFDYDKREPISFIESLKGTIKAHNEYNGELQTELTRCKVL